MRRWLLACGALAAGESVAAAIPEVCACWPAVAVLTVLVGLFGYGLAVRGWALAVIFLIGLMLFFRASVADELTYRSSPWLRNARRNAAIERCEQNPARREFARRTGLGLEHDSVAVALGHAILLGDRRELPQSLKRAFVCSGTMHVFAISGLHVMVFAHLLLLLFVLLQVPYRFAGTVAILPLWGYVMIIGMTPSAVRAAAMASLYYLAPVFGCRPDGLRAWALTFLVVHLRDPRLVMNVGSVLSFTVMLAILLAVQYGPDFGRGLRMMAWVTFVAWIAGVPIAAHVFGRITPGGLLAGVPLLMAAQVTVVTGFVGLALSFVSETLAAHVNNLAALLADAMSAVACAVSDIPGASVEVPAWPFWECGLWYLAIGLSVWLVRNVRARHLI